jgi:predicted dehydrogenase
MGYITTSFDVKGSSLPNIEIYGTKGTLQVPDPNTFGGPIRLLTDNDRTFKEMPLHYDHADNSRALGLSGMADTLENGTSLKANGNLTYHVLEVMESIHKSWETHQFIEIKSRF